MTLPDSIADLTLKSRERIAAALDNLRDGGYSLASLCLTAHRATWMGHDDAARLLAAVIGKALEQAQIAQSIAKEMGHE